MTDALEANNCVPKGRQVLFLNFGICGSYLSICSLKEWGWSEPLLKTGSLMVTYCFLGSPVGCRTSGGAMVMA